MSVSGLKANEITPRTEIENAVAGVESEWKSHHHNATEDQNTTILVINITSTLTQVGGNNSVVLYDDKKRQEKSVVRSNDAKLCEIDSLAAYQQQKGKSFSEVENTEESDERAHFEKMKRKKRPKTKVYSKRLESVVHKSLPPAEQSHSFVEMYKMSDDVMMHVRILRDNGRWDLFEDTAVTLSRKYLSLEAQIVIQLERGIAACYSNRLQDAKKMIKFGIEMARSAENGSVLIGRGHYYLSAVYRRENKTGKAIACVEIADQNLCNNSIMSDTCSLTYERASALMDFISQCAQPRPELVKRVLANLRRSMDECIVLYEDDSFQGYIKTHHYALMKMAMFLLDCRTSAGRKRSVDCENIQEAEKYLTILKERYWDNTSRGEKVQYFFAQADLHFRKKQYERAREFVLKALEMAKSFGFNTEIELARARLEDIENQQELTSLLKTTDHSRVNNDDIVPEPSSGNGDVSSSSDSDWLSKPSLL